METPDQVPETLELPPPEVRDWYFSFGYGQRLHAARAGEGEGEGEGIPLDNCYVLIRGDFQGARMRMYRLFGTVWCDQYAQLPPEITGKDLSFLIGPIGSSQSE